MKNGIINDNQNLKFKINSILNKRNSLYGKLKNLNNIFNCSKQKKIKENIKLFYFTQNKTKRNNNLLNIKNKTTNIKCISYQSLFNFDKNNNNNNQNEINNKDKNKINFPKLFLLKNIKEKENNINNYLYNSILHSSRKLSRNYPFNLEKNLSSSLTNYKNKSYYQTAKDFYKTNNENNNKEKKNNNNNQNFSKYNFFKKNQIINDNKKLIKKSKHFYSSDKIYTSPNYCDASTNTLDLFQKKFISNYKKYKRPLMIDYFYSEHKKFCYGFDKLKGKNKYKKPFFIVHKY